MIKILFVLSLLFCSVYAYALSGDEMPWDMPLEKIQNALTGRTVMIIGIILISAAGVALATSEGGTAKQRIFHIVLGIGIALNAPRVLSLLFGKGEGVLW